MCALIKDKVKQQQQQQQDVVRRKLVVHLMVGQDLDDQTSVHFASRCLWNAGDDSMASATYRNSSLFAVGVVYWLAVS